MHFDLKRKTALVAATAALAIAGCGGDDDDDDGGGEPLSEEDYATEIESVLRTFGEESIPSERSCSARPRQMSFAREWMTSRR